MAIKNGVVEEQKEIGIRFLPVAAGPRFGVVKPNKSGPLSPYLRVLRTPRPCKFGAAEALDEVLGLNASEKRIVRGSGRTRADRACS